MKPKGNLTYLFSIVAIAVLGGFLFGYDTAVISGAERGLEAFFLSATDFQYKDFQHGLTCSSALWGCIIGSLLSGWMAGKWGRKRSLIFAGACFFLSALGSYRPEFLFSGYGKPTLPLLIVFNLYRVLGGIGVGMASAICPMYIAEMSPSNMRGRLVSWNQFAIIFGQLVVYAVNMFILGDHVAPIMDQVSLGISKVLNPEESVWMTEVGWRYMFVSEAIPAGLFTILVCFIPETPRYLTMSGQEDKALNVLTRINGESQAQVILADIKSTTVQKREKLFAYGKLVVFVGIMLSVFQQIIGINAVLYYGPRIFGEIGATKPFAYTLLMGVINILFTLLAIFTVEKWGRKPLLISGSIGMAIGAFLVAFTFGNDAAKLCTLIGIMLYSASFMMSWGPICWVLISEIFPNTIRSQAVAIAVAFQ